MKLRAPATPLITHDPYFSIWDNNHPLGETVHWTGWHNTLIGKAFIDGKEYHFLGYAPYGTQSLKACGKEIDALSTTLCYANDEVKLTVRFTSPMLIDDLYLVSRPVTYCKVEWEALDNKAHEVSVKFYCSEELVLNRAGEGRAWSEEAIVENATAVKMGNGKQNVLWRSGDDVRIDWGYLYLGVEGEGKVGNAVVRDALYSVWVEKKVEKSALFFFAYDDIKSMVYFGEQLEAYWKKAGKSIETVISEALSEYDSIIARCDGFSKKLREDAERVGGEEYADLLTLAYRQVMAAHKLVVDNEGNNLYISKECFSNGCAATVDVTYPSSPLFLIYNTELLKGMLRPIMKYASSDAWKWDFAPHDVGQYPLVNGQVYNTNSLNGQMPVEECGNMIILFSAICDRDGNTDFVKPYLDTVKQWSEYLIKYGLDPEHQLCTDDFAGHLAHNVNLSIKAIMGIAGYSRILAMLGDTEESERLMKIAREYSASLIERAKNSDGSFRLAYDKPETFSLKYNSVWDKIWKTGLFPDSFFKGEVDRYIKEMLTFGVPLDSREKYTKSDWLVWAACLSDTREGFDTLVHSLWNAYNTTRSYVPMTDWYWCDTSEMTGFRHRTVQGGLFIKLMLD
ncbi:MAG: DUF4965 domain-containing protein [Clostridia bacterium]|nr:DUF4965 domain-containing protein [Clostridia bacterium]